MKLKLIHPYHDKLNLYGDKGNVIALKKRAEWRGIEVEVQETSYAKGIDLSQADIIFIGGGSDREQALATNDLFSIKDEFKSAIDDGVCALTICGGYQFLGDYYQLPDGTKLSGLGILDFYTVSSSDRLKGNILLDTEEVGSIVGFENHGGRTYHDYEPLGNVISGHGNNGKDGKEGLRYKNLVGTYLHGPILPKNPDLTDHILSKALERRYGYKGLKKLDNELENKAQGSIVRKIK